MRIKIKEFKMVLLDMFIIKDNGNGELLVTKK